MSENFVRRRQHSKKRQHHSNAENFRERGQYHKGQQKPELGSPMGTGVTPQSPEQVRDRRG
jgi:hypothetical protein